jgi:hypothetical protein
VPTKHKRHAITETPRVKQALDPLRAQLTGERLDLAELVVIGAETKLARVRTEQDDRAAGRKRLADMIRNGELNLDPDLADEAKRAGLPK